MSDVYRTLLSLAGGITVAGRIWDPTSAYISPVLGETWKERGAVLHSTITLYAISL